MTKKKVDNLELFNLCALNDDDAWDTFFYSIDDILDKYIESTYAGQDFEEVKGHIKDSLREYTVRFGEIYLEVTVKRWLYEIM